MDLQSIIEHLKEERSRVEQAIAALEGSPSRTTAVAVRHGKKKAGGITTAGRKRLSELMRKRWAERRKATKKK